MFCVISIRTWRWWFYLLLFRWCDTNSMRSIKYFCHLIGGMFDQFISLYANNNNNNNKKRAIAHTVARCTACARARRTHHKRAKCVRFGVADSSEWHTKCAYWMNFMPKIELNVWMAEPQPLDIWIWTWTWNCYWLCFVRLYVMNLCTCPCVARLPLHFLVNVQCEQCLKPIAYMALCNPKCAHTIWICTAR